MKKISCEIKSLDKKDRDIDMLKESSCLLSISVGQQYHEEDYFASTIDLINNTFGSCVISLYDSLQRYTMAMNYPLALDELHVLANKEGDLWLQRNEKFYSRLKNLTGVVRWDDWLKKAEFDNTKQEVLQLIEQDPSYKKHFNIAVDKYLNRCNKNSDKVGECEFTRVNKLCFNYIVEECVVLRLWMSLNCQFEVYPNLHNEAIEETRKRFANSTDRSILNLLTLSFKNKTQLGKQRFIVLEDLKYATN